MSINTLLDIRRVKPQVKPKQIKQAKHQIKPYLNALTYNV